jgi:DNA-binding PadR family transcriptional regulator
MSTLAVLRAIDAGHRYGFEIMEETGLPGGTVYPALARLEEDELLTSDWEDPALAQADKRPPRRYYDITDHGRRRLKESLAWLGAATSPVREG